LTEQNVKPLAVAWLGSAFAFTIAFIAWMFVTAWLEGSIPPRPAGVLRLGLFAFGASLVVQLAYGGLVYLILTRMGLWSVWTVALAYLLPVVLFSWSASDTMQDILGTIPWLAFASIVAVVSWFFVPTS
jgi:hypothetical protein